jgi:thiosulfate/3-mercaptopyruvate sulfurtransferase
MVKSTVTVSPQWLHEHRDRPEIVIVDCRFSLSDPQLGRQQYLTSHIPGAYYLDLNQDLSSPAGLQGGRHPLPDPLGLARKLSEMGVNSETLVVAYDDSRFAFAARLWWLLRYLGHEQGAVLDGGFSAYQAAGYAITSELPAPRAGALVPKLQLHRVVDVAGVKARKDLPGVVLIDSREAERYRGEREPIDPIAGHIPGAVNYPWQAVSDACGHLMPFSEQLWAPTGQEQSQWAELEQAKEILVYCGSGVTACVNLLALEALGIQTGKLYAGSWSDWCSYKSLPVAQGEINKIKNNQSKG